MPTIYRNGDIRFKSMKEVAEIKLSSNYEMDPQDPLLWRLNFCACKYRTEKKAECPKSGRLTQLPWCEMFDKVVSPNACSACQVPDKT